MGEAVRNSEAPEVFEAVQQAVGQSEPRHTGVDASRSRSRT